jgi:hypothetical protein
MEDQLFYLTLLSGFIIQSAKLWVANRLKSKLLAYIGIAISLMGWICSAYKVETIDIALIGIGAIIFALNLSPAKTVKKQGS